MLVVRKSKERGHADHGWLRTYHTFSFADYQDPNHMGFRTLRVINEDYVKPNQGFATHSHRDMEIVTYILSGALEHRDSMGNTSVIVPGEVQRMTAGTGVTHSEFNASKNEEMHLLQIWILPEKNGLTPGYEQKKFPAEDKDGRWRLVASRDGRDGSVTVHQFSDVFAATLGGSQKLDYVNHGERGAWLQVARGSLKVLKGTAYLLELEAGDGLAVTGKETIQLTHGQNAEILLFDLA